MSHLKLSELRARQKPSPLRLRGGEGWVRGLHTSNYRSVRSALRCPLPPSLSPKPRLGEREPTASEAA